MPSLVCCRSLASSAATELASSSRARQAACSWDLSTLTCAGALLITLTDQLCSFDRVPAQRLRALRAYRSPSSGLRPPPHQHQIGRARRQQPHGKRDVHSLAGGFEGRSHHGENIRRFWSGSLAQYFRPIQDSFTTQGFKPEMAPGGRGPGISLACEAPAARRAETPSDQAR